MKYLITGRGIVRKVNTVEGLVRIATDFAETEKVRYQPDRAMSRLAWALELLVTELGFKVTVAR